MQKISLFLLLFVLSVSFGACSKKSEVPAKTGEPVAPAPAKEADIPPAKAPEANAGFDGRWEGDSGNDLPLQFYIEDNQVKNFHANYSVTVNNCSANGSFGSEDSAPIHDKAFATTGTSSSGSVKFNAVGVLKSPTEAAGTVDWKGNSSICGEFEIQYQWQAKKVPESE